MKAVELPPGFKPNPGHCPEEARGKRVRVILNDGEEAKTSWPADGKGGCRWAREPRYPFAIAGYRVDE